MWPCRHSFLKFKEKNLPASWAHSHRTQLVSLTSLGGPRACDSIVVLCAPKYLNVALRARSYILRIHISLFLVIWYWSSSQFYNIVDVSYIFSKLLNFFFFYFKWKKKFNLLKVLSALRNTFLSWHLRFALDFLYKFL